MKKILTLLLVAVMALAFVPAMAEEATDYAAWFDGVDTSEHVVITMLVTGNVPTNKTDDVLAVFNEKLNAAINAELQIQWIEWADWQTKYNLALAMQDGSIDLIGTATDWLDAWPNAENGAFYPLSEDLLATYAPKTWASVPADHWDVCKYDGTIYIMPEDNYAQWTNHGFMYRGDWAAEAGLTEGVNSWEDVGTYLQYVKDNKEGVIPWDAAGSGSSIATENLSGWLFSKDGVLGIEGLPVALFYGNSKDDPYTLSNVFLEGDSLVNFATMMKQWADAGYWREDVLNYQGETRELFKDGATGADRHHTQTWRALRTEMEERQPGSDLGFFWFGKESDNLVSLNITHGAMAVAAQSKNPERALMVYDLIRNDPELYSIFNFGLEGQQYVIDERGYRGRPDSYVDDLTSGASFNFWWGRNDDLEIRDAKVDWEAYDKLVQEYDKVSIIYPYGQIVFNRDPISVELDNLSNVYNTYVPVLAYGKMDDPAAYVAEFREALKAAGLEAAMAEVQAQLDAVYGK